MTSLFSILATSTQPASQIASAAADPADSPAAIAFLLSVLATGLCVLVVWLIRRAVHPDRLLLTGIPGRPNHLGWLHVGLIVGWAVLNKVTGFVAGRSEPPSNSMLGQYIVMAGVMAVAIVLGNTGFRHGLIRGMGLSGRRWIVDTVRGVIGGLAVYPVCFGLVWLGQRFLPEALRRPHELLQSIGGGSLTMLEQCLAVALAVIVAPIVEETLYRGVLQTALRRLLGGPWTGIVVSSAIFAAIHMSVLPEPVRVMGLEVFAPIFLLAIVLGYNYERTGRLWSSIVIHMIFNGINVMSTLLNT